MKHAVHSGEQHNGTVVLWLPPKTRPADAVEYVVVNAERGIAASGTIGSGHADMDPQLPARPAALVAALEAGSAVYAVLDGTETACTHVELPGAMRARALRQALPFLVEEFLTTPPEQMHVTAGQRRSNSVRTAAIGHADLDRALTRLERLDIPVDGVLAEPDTLATPPDEARLLLHPGRGLIDIANLGGGVFEGADCHELILRLLRERGPRALTVYLSRGTTAEAEAGDCSGERVLQDFRAYCSAHDVRLDVEEIDASLRQWQSTQLLDAVATAPDLLQGRYARRRREDPARIWRRSALAIALLLTLITIANGFIVLHHRRGVQTDLAAARMLYGRLFPDEQVAPSTLRSRLAAHLQRMETPDVPGFPARARQALQPLAAAVEAGEVKVRRIRFDARADALRLELAFPRVEQAEAYRNSASVPTWPATLTDVRPENDGVAVTVRFGGNEAPP